jgi:hypothetical protein
MSKSPSRKTQERRRTPRSPRGRKAAAPAAPAVTQDAVEKCQNCGQDLRNSERALLVEEENGRLFCAESCIGAYFAPEIERLEKHYFKLLAPGDLSPEDREKYSHLRWVTLEEPDEVWKEKTLAGDHRYTLIAEFRPDQKKPVWCVCIALFLRGEPSFLYLAFPTRNAAMVNHYRRGDRIQWSKPRAEQSAAALAQSHAQDEGQSEPGSQLIDGLAASWTEEETRMAEMSSHRRADDIPVGEFALYQACLEETLEQPDEVWSQPLSAGPSEDEGEAEEPRTFHFMRRYEKEAGAFWYIVVARETEDEEQIEILEAFPTRDGELVGQYRRGQREGEPSTELAPASRLVH